MLFNIIYKDSVDNNKNINENIKKIYTKIRLN